MNSKYYKHCCFLRVSVCLSCVFVYVSQHSERNYCERHITHVFITSQYFWFLSGLTSSERSHRSCWNKIIIYIYIRLDIPTFFSTNKHINYIHCCTGLLIFYAHPSVCKWVRATIKRRGL